MNDSGQEKSLSAAIAERRATRHFSADAVPEHHLGKILEAGLAAPSGYNLQPWRFVVVRDAEQRKRLREAAMGQPKVEEAPVVIVACGDPLGWKTGDLDEVLRLAEAHGSSADQRESIRRNVTKFLGRAPGQHGGINPDLAVWVNRQVMLAFTTMMWMAESLGYDTAPMEGFWEDKVRAVLAIPDSVRVVALLAMGRREDADKPFAGRFPMSHTVYAENWGDPIRLTGER
jgi:nitroreductase